MTGLSGGSPVGHKLAPSEMLDRYFDRSVASSGPQFDLSFEEEPRFLFDGGEIQGASNESFTLPRARTNIEAVMGLFAAFLIGIPAPIFVMTAILHVPGVSRELLCVLAFLALIATGYLCITVIRIGGRAVEGDRPGNSFYLARETDENTAAARKQHEFFIPLALAMAIRLPNWWAVVRPLIAIWWLAHFVTAALIGHMVVRQLNGVNNPGVGAILFRLALTMAFLFAANLYLMLAIAVSIPRSRIWVLAWRNRFVVDLVVTAGMLATA